MSKYLSAFESVSAELKESFQLIGDCLIVELLKEDEVKTKSGIVLAESANKQITGLHADRPTFARVLMVGEGYYDDGSDTMEARPLDSRPGDIVLIGRTSVKHLSTFGKLVSTGDSQLGLCLESDIQMRFRGQAGFDSFFSRLNQSVSV